MHSSKKWASFEFAFLALLITISLLPGTANAQLSAGSVTGTSIIDSIPSGKPNKDGNPALIFFRRLYGKQLQKLVSGEMMIESKLGA